MNVNVDNLPSATAMLLLRLSKEKYMKRFSLVGGTALALQLGHRQSEDLDFIFDSETIDGSGIKRFIAPLFPNFCLIRDYYDLYFIARNIIPLAGIYQTTRSLIPNLSPITYSETIVYTRDIPENEIGSHLFPKVIVSKEEISNYFIEEIRKMKPDG